MTALRAGGAAGLNWIGGCLHCRQGATHGQEEELKMKRGRIVFDLRNVSAE